MRARPILVSAVSGSDHFATVGSRTRIGIYLVTCVALVVALAVGGAGVWATLVATGFFLAVAVGIEVRRRTLHRSGR